jgi:hypothetical protein
MRQLAKLGDTDTGSDMLLLSLPTATYSSKTETCAVFNTVG